MKVRHSDSLILIWRVAEFEARQLKASTIEPTHLLLGLAKCVDLDLPAFVSKDAPDRDEVLEELLHEVRRLRSVFRAAGLDAKAFRRRLRRASGGNRFSPSESDRLRRSPSAKRVFNEAEHFAELANCLVYPAHLLYAVLLTEDQNRDEVLVHIGVNRKSLQEAAKRVVLFRPNTTSPTSKKDRNRWN